MDYDQTCIPDVYDQARAYGPGTLALWMNAIARHVKPAHSIIDLGCGTGRYTQALSDFFDVEVLGLEPSEAMLARAEAKRQTDRVRYARGAGDAIPRPDGGDDLVFLSMVYHHLPDVVACARECARVLCPGGALVVRNGVRDVATPYDMHFPNYRTIYERRTPSREQIVREIEAGGLKFSAHEIVRHPMADNWKAFADKVALRADSNLILLSEADYRSGMTSLRRAANAADDAPVLIDVDLFVFRRAAACEDR